MDHPDTSGAAAELDADAGMGEREDGFPEPRRKGPRVPKERQETVQSGGGAAPVWGAIQESAYGIDKGVGWVRGFEGLPHFPRGAVQGGGGGQGPGKGDGVAGSG